MSSHNTLLLISEFPTDEIVSKLIFLRSNDKISVSNYDDAVFNLENSQSDIVFVQECSSRSKTIELIEKLRVYKNISIILLYNSYNNEFILSAYDAGIDDFISSKAENFEYVMRTVRNIKENSVKLKAFRNFKLLEQLSVVDELTGFYSNKYTKQVIENEIDNNLITDGVFMALSPQEASKMFFSIEKMSNAIVKSIRVDDIAALGKSVVFFVFMPNTSLNGALTVLNKIKENYDGDVEFCAGISGIAGKVYNEFEKDALNSLAEALASNNSFVFADEKADSVEDWLDIDKKSEKNYKIFKQIFQKKMEKIIAPVFFRLQKSWEERLFETKFEQYTNDEQCVFHLKNKNQDSKLTIVYPGFAKILIYITHEGLDSPENQEIQLPLTKINQKDLVAIIENFIKEFKYSS